MEVLVSDDQQYSYPGYHTSQRFSQDDLEVMLSSRRAVKLLQTIGNLPAKMQDSNCARLFEQAFLAHTNAFNRILKHENDPSSPQNQQSLMATIEAMCAAMFITADIGRNELLANQFQQLDRFSERITPVLAHQKVAKPEGAAFMLEGRITPDLKVQVNVLRLVALRLKKTELLKQVDAECVSAKMIPKEISVVAWDARTTWFDVLLKRPMDTSKGVTKYSVYDWQPDDLVLGRDSQKQLVDRLRLMVLPPQR